MMVIKFDWSKELWLALFFVCIGFTVWPLMIYYLSQYLGIDFFRELPLRVWAEQIVYGPLSFLNLRSLLSLLFLLSPYLFANLIRLLLLWSRQRP